MFDVEIQDTKNWKTCIAAIVNLIKEGAFEISKDGFTLKAMDPSQIAMVGFSVDKDNFSEYTVDSKARVGLDIENLSRILSRCRNDDKIRIEYNGGRLEVVFDNGKCRRNFKLPVIDVPECPSKELNINYTAIIKMKGSIMKEILKDVALIGPHVLLVADEDKFKIEASGDNGEVEMVYNKDENIDINTKRTTSAVFSQEYLNDIIKGCEDEGKLEINLGAPTAEDPRPKPLLVRYNIGKASFSYYLAPRIETE